MATISEVENNLIYITGFGPFYGHEKSNSSWEAVRLLPDTYKFNDKLYVIKKLEIPVIYNEIDKIIPTIWDSNPKLVIHCGVHGNTNKLQIEKCANNNDFCKADYTGECLPSNSVPLINNTEICSMLTTNFNVDKIIDEIKLCNKQCNNDEMYKCSYDVGNYICGYTYLKSLDINAHRTIFVHVPRENKPFTIEEIKTGIYSVMEKCMEQLNENNYL